MEIRQVLNNAAFGLPFGAALLWAKLLGRYVPFSVQIMVTDRCNLRCSYCFGRFPERGKKELSTEQLMHILDELASIGARRITLTGGEALLRNDIGMIIDYVKRKGMECILVTNGYFIPKRLNEIKRINALCISLDGDKEAHDSNRGAGSYEKAMEAIRIARENNIPLQVSTVLTRDNIHSIDYVLNEGKKWGFTVGFTPLVNQSSGNTKTYTKNIPTDEEYREVLRHIIRRKREGYPVLFSYKTLDHALNWKYGYKKDKIFGKDNHATCNAGRYCAFIDTNGDMYPCCLLIDEVKPLNCLEVGVKRAFAHVNEHNCRACYSTCQNEHNLMYALDIGVILNIILNMKR